MLKEMYVTLLNLKETIDFNLLHLIFKQCKDAYLVDST